MFDNDNNIDYYTGIVVKPGRCPKNKRPDIVCIQVVRPGDCINDNSCPGNEKCFKQGCFRTCLDPGKLNIISKGTH